MIEKVPWPDGEKSPWAGKANRPTVWEVARAYPGKAIGHAVMAFIFGAMAAAFIVVGEELAARALFGIPKPTSVPAYLPVVQAPLFAGLWWLGMYSEIRGWATFSSRD
jgi:hypothetical protein